MPTKLKHVAIVSHNIDQLQRFYSTLFGMKSSGDRQPGAGAAVVSDGTVDVNSDNAFVRQFLSGESQGPLGME